MNDVKIKVCKRCNSRNQLVPDDEFWRSEGTIDYKLWQCKYCGRYHIIEQKADSNLDVNNDKRFYTYH